MGHLIGLDVHDAGGYAKGHPSRSPLPGLRNLRTSRILEKGIVITVEPGLYFRDFLLDGEFGEGLNIPLDNLNRDLIREYQKEVNGVRIEDVVLITEDGCENFAEDLPRTTEEIEKCMAGESWK